MQQLLTITAPFMEALKLKSRRLYRHSIYVGLLAKDVGIALGYSESDAELLQMAGFLHDIGKIAIRDDILSKPYALTPEEWEQMYMHPVLGAEALKRFKGICNIETISKIVEAHHEREDGSGYPYGVRGDGKITRETKIISICDIYAATVNERPYKCAYPQDRAIQIAIDMVSRNGDAEVIKQVLMKWDKRTMHHHIMHYE